MDTTLTKNPGLQEYLNEFTQCITTKIDVKSFVLFGGITLDDFSKKYSDIDLVVVLKDGLTEEKSGIIEQAITELMKYNPVYTNLLFIYTPI